MPMANATLTVKSDPGNLSEIRRFVEKFAVDVGLAEELMSELRLAVDEACANIILHGYKGGDGDISLFIDADDAAVHVTLTDKAPPFNPLTDSAAPSLDLPLEERPVGGMGVMLVKQNVDGLEYRQGVNGENVLVLTKQVN